MTSDQLADILAKHDMWLRGVGGERANLEGAYIARANLEGASLRYASLRYANLRGADLEGANLRGASLRYANLVGANLVGANLRGASLRYANLRGANLVGASLVGAYIARANLEGANLEGANFGDDVPVVANLDACILAAVEGGGTLDMGNWHGADDNACGTTHCRAGWAVTLGGELGAKLEDRMGPAAAGALIYARNTGRVPNFFCSNDEALADIKACAGK